LEVKIINNFEPKFFKISNKKVIDISKLIDQKKQTSTYSTILLDPENTVDRDLISSSSIYGILNYENINSGTRIISKAYQYLINYIKNPSSLLLLKDSDLPKEIVNLFDLLSKKILTPTVLIKDNILNIKLL